MLYQPKPRIDYTLKAVGGSLTAIPGLSDMIDVKLSSVPNFLLAHFFPILLLILKHTDCDVLLVLVGYREYNCYRYAPMAP